LLVSPLVGYTKVMHELQQGEGKENGRL